MCFLQIFTAGLKRRASCSEHQLLIVMSNVGHLVITLMIALLSDYGFLGHLA